MKSKKQKTDFWKILDLVVLIISPLIAVTVSILSKTNLLVSTFLFYGLLSIYFSYRTPKGIVRALIFTSLVTIPMYFVIDYVATRDNSWFVPTIFSFRPYGILSLEELFWFFLCTYSILIFYEHFLDKGSHRDIGGHLKYLVVLIVLLVAGFIWFYLNNQFFLAVPYAYLQIGVFFMLIPMCLLLCFYPKFLNKFLKITIYFFVLNLLHEITALQLGQWTFPGPRFVGWIDFLGYKFPLEELFFFILLCPVSLLSYFEYFDDNRFMIESKRG